MQSSPLVDIAMSYLKSASPKYDDEAGKAEIRIAFHEFLQDNLENYKKQQSGNFTNNGSFINYQGQFHNNFTNNVFNNFPKENDGINDSFNFQNFQSCKALKNLARENLVSVLQRRIGNLQPLEKIEAILAVPDIPLGNANENSSNIRDLSTMRKKTRPWSQIEDMRLLLGVHRNGLENWIQVAKFVGNGRTRAQCAQRWFRGLDPRISKDQWSQDEESKLLNLLVENKGKGWTFVAAHMGNRSDVQCRYHFLQMQKEGKIPPEVSEIVNASDKASEKGRNPIPLPLKLPRPSMRMRQATPPALPTRFSSYNSPNSFSPGNISQNNFNYNYNNNNSFGNMNFELNRASVPNSPQNVFMNNQFNQQSSPSYNETNENHFSLPLMKRKRTSSQIALAPPILPSHTPGSSSFMFESDDPFAFTINETVEAIHGLQGVQNNQSNQNDDIENSQNDIHTDSLDAEFDIFGPKNDFGDQNNSF
ncbi:hypothetical protein TRFO_22383 [Tritrichomonas foetus]|uniref:Myb-like DNA-binding domain containing protein n=1 Tax=Tritrichomonas foetus TaxID=1144522 RepID=A0A1J4KCF9_9EUKA|nr:hypothetical protein TRFO_22383 [Tritrichomonas foetus]|eukprot:OHT08899.1 hypothetical protein TRFO_22383 [Tritrichomonas foetus]